MSTRQIRGQGFTLIELLVVIALLAILAAILFPVFAQARDKARLGSCLSNHKQIAMGVLLYVEDYDGRFPGGPGRYGLFFPGPEGNWENMPTRCCKNLARTSVAVQLRAYLKNTQLLRCPNDPTGAGPLDAGDARFARGSYEWPAGISQGLSYPNFPSIRGGIVTGKPILLAEVSRPSLLFINNENIFFHSPIRSGQSWLVFAFADGHVKFTKWLDFWLPPQNSPWTWTWNNPRRPVELGRPCEPTCMEAAARN